MSRETDSEKIEVGSLLGSALGISCVQGVSATEWAKEKSSCNCNLNQNAIIVKTSALDSDGPLSVPSCGGVSQLYPLASTSLWTQAVPEKGLDL